VLLLAVNLIHHAARELLLLCIGSMHNSNVTSTFYLGEGPDQNTYTQRGGTATLNNVRVGSNNSRHGNGRIVMEDGTLSATGDFQVGMGDNLVGVVDQSGGDIVLSNVSQQLQIDNINATYSFDGGSLTIKKTTDPILFDGGTVTNSFFDFGAPGAVLNLYGTWDYAALSSVANQRFTVEGQPLADGMLSFTPVTIESDLYTAIQIVPEPTAISLAAVGLLGLVGFGRRRKR
jgi:hypothetical protein